MKNHKIHEENPFERIECEISVGVLNKISELSKTSLRIYKYINEYAHRQDGFIFIDKKELKFELEFRENKSIYNGLSELLSKDILAADTEKDRFYYNPKYIAHGK